MKICVISGSNRAGNNSIKIARIVAAAHESAGAEVELLDLRELPQDLLTPEAYNEKPAEFDRFRDAVLGSKGLAIVVPEYNGSFPGVLKLFIDMLPYPDAYEGRAVSFTGLAAGRWGALRSVEQLQLVWGYRNTPSLPRRVFIPEVFEQLDGDGALKDDEIQARIGTQAEEFVAFCRALFPS